MNPLVIAWVVASAIGLALSVYLTIESWRDIAALGDRANGRRTVARSRFIREGMRVTVQWAWLLLGLAVLRDVPVGSLFVAALLYGNIAMGVNSLVDARSRPLLHHTRSTEPEIPYR
jgi:hypothetical protein